MTKKDLMTAICNANPNFSHKTLQEALNLFFEMIVFYLSHHQRVELRGFGVFSVRKRKAHKAHNPQTGEILSVESKYVPFFRPSQNLKKHLIQEKQKHPKNTKKAGFLSALYRDWTR